MSTLLLGSCHGARSDEVWMCPVRRSSIRSGFGDGVFGRGTAGDVGLGFEHPEPVGVSAISTPLDGTGRDARRASASVGEAGRAWRRDYVATSPGSSDWLLVTSDGSASGGQPRCAARRALELAQRGAMRTTAEELARQHMVGDRCGRDPEHLWSSVLTLVYAGSLADAESYCVNLARQPEWQRSEAGWQMLRLLRSRISYLAGEPPSNRESIGSMLSGGLADSLFGIAMAWQVEELLQYGAVREANLLLLRHDCSGAASEDVPVDPFVYSARAAVLLASGQAQRAVADFVVCGRELAGRGVRNPAVLAWRSRAAVAALAIQRRDLALALVQEELTAARMWGTSRVVGEALHALGLILGSGKGDDGLAEAIDLLEVAGARHEIVRAAYELGRRSCDGGDFGPARERLRVAARHAEATGNDHWVERVAFVLRRTGMPSKESLLTKQEAKIATLARAGYSNQEIAGNVCLAIRTVEYHLSAVYRKLGISGRRDLYTITAEFE